MTPRISFVIKTLNEEAHIRRCIESILPLRVNHTVQIIMADSASTDRTVEYAAEYPIDIVQLRSSHDRSCGVGAQLGYQHSDGEFLYIIDGDMEFVPGFLDIALESLRRDDGLAGVGGMVEERAGTGNYEYERRKVDEIAFLPGEVDVLNGGGLYRRSALNDVGYLTDRNLHSYEEKDLGYRLVAKGHRLIRLPTIAVGHYGKTDTTGVLLAKRWKSRYFDGAGEFLRSALGKPYLGRVLKLLWKFIVLALSYLLLALGIVLLNLPLVLCVSALHILLYSYFLVRSRSLKTALIAYVNLNVLSLALIRGLFAKPINPAAPIDSIVVKSWAATPRGK